MPEMVVASKFVLMELCDNLIDLRLLGSFGRKSVVGGCVFLVISSVFSSYHVPVCDSAETDMPVDGLSRDMPSP